MIKNPFFLEENSKSSKESLRRTLNTVLPALATVLFSIVIFLVINTHNQNAEFLLREEEQTSKNSLAKQEEFNVLQEEEKTSSKGKNKERGKQSLSINESINNIVNDGFGIPTKKTATAASVTVESKETASKETAKAQVVKTAAETKASQPLENQMLTVQAANTNFTPPKTEFDSAEITVQSSETTAPIESTQASESQSTESTIPTQSESIPSVAVTEASEPQSTEIESSEKLPTPSELPLPTDDDSATESSLVVTEELTVETSQNYEEETTIETAEPGVPSLPEDNSITMMTLYVLGDSVNLRASANNESDILLTLNTGDAVFEYSRVNNWSHVRWEDGTEGYIASEYLSTVEVLPDVTQPGEPSESVEEPTEPTEPTEPNESTEPIEPSATETTEGSEHTEPSEINSSEETSETEPIETTRLRPEETTPLPANPESIKGGESVVSLANQLLGKSYVLGATGPDSFDCSGLVQYIYKKLGKEIGRTTYDQVYDGIEVKFNPGDFSNIAPGDLLLFESNGDVFHVGLYVGNGKMIHAANPSTGVLLDDVNSAYYLPLLRYVRRIFY